MSKVGSPMCPTSQLERKPVPFALRGKVKVDHGHIHPDDVFRRWVPCGSPHLLRVAK